MINPFNTELNLICHLLALLGAHLILHVSRIRVKLIKSFSEIEISNIPIYIQQDATLHGLFNLETALHVSGGTTIHHQKCKQLYLQHLVFVRPLLLSAAIAAGSSILEYSYDARTHER
jgi:hypothetical protein